MRMTIVTDDKGKLVASMFEDASQRQVEGGPTATLGPGPGQVFQEVEVPDDYARLSPDELHRELQKYVSKEAW